MRISIVTPSLNQCGFIPEMLASLGSQDYPDWEHVVFDAGSTDGSVEVWREWEEGIAGSVGDYLTRIGTESREENLSFLLFFLAPPGNVCLYTSHATPFSSS